MYVIDNEWIYPSFLEEIISEESKVELSDDTREAVAKCRAFLDEKVESADKLIYGVNTGFGSLCDTAISSNDLERLQRNLVVSHACGAGEEVPREVGRECKKEGVKKAKRFYNGEIWKIFKF